MTSDTPSTTDHRQPPADSLAGLPVTDGPCTTSPQAAGFDPLQLARLDQHFAGLIRKERLQAASYLLARRGKIFAWRSIGHLKAGDHQTPFLPDSVRFIASITKLYTAIGIMKLYEDGIYNIYEPVSGIIPEFGKDDHKRITAFHLLTHTSGLRADTGYFQESWPLAVPLKQAGDTDPAAWITRVLAGPPQSRPGEAWSYCSLGYCVLGEIISRASGLDYMDYIEQRICRPLGLKDTRFNLSPAQHRRSCIADPAWINQKPRRRHGGPGSVPPAAGGLHSTLFDLWRTGQCLLQDGSLGKVRLLGRKTMETMRANQLNHIPAFWWGKRVSAMPYSLGMQLGKDQHMGLPTFGHEGYGSSCLFIDPDKELVAVYFACSPFGWTQEAVDNPRAIIWAGLD